mgnify:FL=1
MEVNADNAPGQSLKQRTARTLKWNTIDRVSQQVALAVIGVVLANLLSREDYGLTGVIAMFQAFAIVFVDSGFGAALLQKKETDERDYSTVFWFNTAVAVGIYILLWFAAPLIADFFRSERLVLLSRVMFLSFILNALGIVQTNRLMKQMEVRQIALSNLAGLAVSGAVGIWLAVMGWGVWALVWQTVSLAFVKTAWLWLAVRWRPVWVFSRESMRSIRRVGMGVFSSSLLNTFFLNLYTFVIGRWSLGMLGVYTQADKWSKMGTASLSQIITATFVPLLSRFQDDAAEFVRYMRRVDRFAALTVVPLMAGLAMIATPLFHTLFGTKWDDAIPLFQILSLRGVFIIFISAYNNYLLAAGRAGSLVAVETVKDVAMLAALAVTIFIGTVEALVWGQMVASAITWVYVLLLTSSKTSCRVRYMLADMVPALALSAVALAAGWGASLVTDVAAVQLALRIAVAAVAYVALACALRLPEVADARAYLLKRRK